jgi:hypothetical protein
MSLMTLMGAGAPANNAMVESLRVDLAGYWKLEEAAGTRFDSSPQAADLTENGGPGNAPGVIGDCVSLDGTTQYLSRPTDANIEVGDFDFEWWGWVNFNALGDQEVMSKYGGVGDGFLLDLSAFLGDQLLFQGYNTGVSIGFVTNGAALSASTWYFFDCWHDSVANTVNMRVDNGATQSAATILPGTDSGDAFGLGARASAPSLYVNGLIDEVGFRKGSLLTDPQRAALFALTVPY